MRAHGPRCAVFMPIRVRGRWWRWNREPAFFPAVWLRLSGCVISVAAPLTATPQSATATTPDHGPPAALLPGSMGWGYASDVTTSKKPPAGACNPVSTKYQDTQHVSP